MNNGMLNLGVQTQTQPVPAQFPGMMQQQQFGQQMYQQPAPPSEMEMQILLLRGMIFLLTGLSQVIKWLH